MPEFDPNKFIVETNLLKKRAVESNKFDPNEFISATPMEMVKKGEEEVSKKLGRFAVGVTQGAGEMLNLPAIPGMIERGIRFGNVMKERVGPEGEGFFGKVKRAAKTAGEESFLPAPTLQESAAGLRTGITYPFRKGSLEDIYKEELESQKEFQKEYSSPSGEITGAVISIVPSVIAAGKSIVGGARKVGSLAKAVVGTVRKQRNVPNLVKEALQRSDGEIVQAILERPEEVQKVLRSGKFSVDELSKTLASKLEETKQYLGKQVGNYRNIVKADDVDKIPTKPLLERIEALEKSFQQKPTKKIVQVESVGPDGVPIIETKEEVVQGASALRNSEISDLNRVKSLLQKEKLSPKEALDVVDEMYAMADPVLVESGRYKAPFSYAVRDLRRTIKSEISKTSPELDNWSKADEAFVGFQESSNPVIRKLESNQRNAFVDGLLNKNKEPVVEQLTKSLGYVESAKGGEFSGFKQKFFDNLAELKAAQGLKARELKISDPIADNVARIIAKYEKRGEQIGGLAGAVLTGIGGGYGGGYGGGGVGTLTGLFGGKKIGGLIGRSIGEKAVDPSRLLQMVINSKTASKDLKAFVNDLLPLAKELKAEGITAVLGAMSGNRLVDEFVKETH